MKLKHRRPFNALCGVILTIAVISSINAILMHYRYQSLTDRKQSAASVDILKINLNSQQVILPTLSSSSRHETKPTRGKMYSTETSLEFYRPRDHIVNSFPYNYHLPPPGQICSGHVSLVILVNSRVDSFDKRLAVRSSWGQVRLASWWPQVGELNVNISLGFVVGLSPNATVQNLVQEEAETFRDMIQGTFVDDYRNMTYKSLQGMKFLMDFCLDVKTFVKCDDDIFLHVPNLLKVSRNAVSRSIIGRTWSNARCRRSGKWQLSVDEYPLKVFPPYEAGSAYVMTMDLVKPLFNLSHYVPHIFIDDVYITGILGKILNINHIKKYSGLFPVYANTLKSICSIFTVNTVAFHDLSPEELLKLWDFMTSEPSHLKEKCNIS